MNQPFPQHKCNTTHICTETNFVIVRTSIVLHVMAVYKKKN